MHQIITKMSELFTLLLLIINVIVSVKCESILGCGGFVKSHVPIDFSKVEVKLLTKHGILKDKINCAPNNGYYFVPLYDKGEYTLELEPPPGWSFSPTKVDLIVDGDSDLCSQGKDINFNFKGFGITGKVESLGDVNGPDGIDVELISETETRNTLTKVGGGFFFTPVFPGKYVVKIKNSKWKLLKDSVIVVVTEGNTELPLKSLIIEGYDVNGVVKDEGEPIKDTIIVLYADGNSDVKVDGCDNSALLGLHSTKKPLCHVKTNEKGAFKFGVVPFGKFYVSPFYNEQNIYYKPELIKFTVEHGSVNLKEEFEIIGFSTNGRVLSTNNGRPLSNAKIFLNGKEVTKTNSNGIYQLEKLKAGNYILQAVAEDCLFKQVTMKINPNTKIPDLVPASYKVCGTVASEKTQRVTISQVGSTTILTTLSDPNTGQFCEFLHPAKYQVQVVVDQIESKRGVQFYPKVHDIEVDFERTGSIIFSQLKATVTGKVQCLHKKDCIGLKILLKPIGDSTDRNEVIINISDNSFTISEIHPGLYEVTLSSNLLCWKLDRQTVNVNNVMVEVPTFVQIGYSVIFLSSHDAQIGYKTKEQGKQNLIKISKGKLLHCLEHPGTYVFELTSCHSYESNLVSYSTDSSKNEIFLTAQKHTLRLFLESENNHGMVSATININAIKTIKLNLPFKKIGYEIELLLSPGETAVIIPQSEVLYFIPPILSVTGGSDCENLGVKFKAVLGVVFKGKIIPPLAGVLVTVESENSDSLHAETDQKGLYQFPPLDTSKDYKITAKKDSYVLVASNNDGDFLAQKLAEVVIEVVDSTDNAPLQGALLSLSGGDSYRSNLQTNEEGKISFYSLSPGEYFLRPMMKEYSFVPNSKIIKVDEGQAIHIKLIGKRVAFSAYGKVASLNGDPEENIAIVAFGVGNCSHFSEETVSESTGYFRIRGLQPYCSYEITIRNIVVGKDSIERTAPKAIDVKRVNQDIAGLELVLFRTVSRVDLLVRVYAKNPDHYKSLRLKVVCETSTNVVYTGKVDTSSIAITADTNNGVMMHIPPIPFDGKTYSVHLESTLNNKLIPGAVFFAANSSFKYVELDFVVKTTTSDQDIKQTPLWTLAFVFGVMFAIYNIDKVSQFLKDLFGGILNDFLNAINRKTVNSDYSGDTDDIDQIVQSINAVKRKPKSRRL